MARRTWLEQIIKEQAGRTFVGNVGARVDRYADEFAREIFADDNFRRTIHELIRVRCQAIMDELLRRRKAAERRGSRTQKKARRRSKKATAAAQS